MRQREDRDQRAADVQQEEEDDQADDDHLLDERVLAACAIESSMSRERS